MEDVIAFLPFLQFTNRLDESEAEHMCFTNGFLWRSDSSRIAMIKTAFRFDAHWEYPVHAFSTGEPVLKIGWTENGVCHIRTTSGKEVSISPVSPRNDPKKLRLFKQREEETTAVVDTKKMTRSLLMMKAAFEKERVSDKQAVMALHPLQKEIRAEGIKTPFSFNIGVQKDGGQSARYAFPLLHDLLINARSITPELTMHVYDPHYTTIRYHGTAWSAITHKRDPFFAKEETG